MTLFAKVAALAESLAREGSKLKKRAAIAEAIAHVHEAAPESDDAGRFALYLAGQPFPESDGRKLNAGGALLSGAVKALSSADDRALTAAYRRHGDLGAAAHELLVASRGEGALEVSLNLDEIAKTFAAVSSARTTASRLELIVGMLRKSTALEAKYLIKLMLGDMRIGVKQSLVEEAIAAASKTEPAAVRHAVMLEADLSKAVARAFAGTLGEAAMQLFHPLGFMLASPVDTPEEAVERFKETPIRKNSGASPAKRPRKKKSPKSDFEDLPPSQQETARDAAEAGLAEDVEREASEKNGVPRERGISPAFLEDKYDGMRAQVHCGDPAQPGRVGIYSRNREEITASFPDLAEAFARINEPMILDGEILGWDYERSQALPFTILTQRIGRKRVSDDLRKEIPVVFMAFDLLYAQGELLLARPFAERRGRLETAIGQWSERAVSPLASASPVTTHPTLFLEETPIVREEIRLMLSPAVAVRDAASIEQAYADARGRSNEGVMLKAGNSAYLPGRRGLAWLKLKRRLATLDVVITGAEFGHGKRAGLLSDYTFAVRDEAGGLLNVGKAYSGITDEEILELTGWLKEHTLEDRGHFRTVEPQIILEVAFNNIMRSTRHASGFALRFPRIVNIRRDKPVNEIDTIARVEEIYQSQPDKPTEVESEEVG